MTENYSCSFWPNCDEHEPGQHMCEETGHKGKGARYRLYIDGQLGLPFDDLQEAIEVGERFELEGYEYSITDLEPTHDK